MGQSAPQPNPQDNRQGTSQLIDPDTIASTIKKYFRIQLKPLDRPVYRKPNPEWVDQMIPLPRGFKTPDFTIFSGEDGKSTMEHIGRFTAQCGESSHNEYHKLQLFPLSLTGTAFTWYSSLPLNSVQNWADMERCFHDRFYWPQPQVTVTDLTSLRQQADESAADYIERFRKKAG